MRLRPQRPLRTLLTTVTAGLAAAGCLTAAGPANANSPTGRASSASSDIGAGHACSPTVSLDRFSDALDKTTYDGTFVGNLSALAVDRNGDLAALSDRSSLFTLDRRTLSPTSAVPLADETGAALDSEGLVVDGDGTRLVSSETEPSVRRYSRDGRILDRLPVPDALRVAPAGRATANQTFEGLTLLPGGRTLLASMEYAISGDSTGIVRWQTWERRGGHAGHAGNPGSFVLGAQYAYRTDAGLGVPEVAATPDGRFLVLERGFTAGVGNTVRLYLADPRHATDTSGVENLTGQDGVRLVRKTLLADIVNCPSQGATAKQPQPNPLLDNVEGMVITGRTHGDLRVLLVSDDNQNAVQTTRFYYLRVRTP
ncbi:esterase-like activity of phytase family protein [Streptomyces sp. WI04-05B]|uniref:esterase-like activity of phytase family protein n=1 Tax=Streptomyces TaxID=1883 RepID=UPI0029B632BC|nr:MULTISPECIES: esterase-like activity of phytase family protein [unclassified Streptomyces]MDX2543872.1 esterase-like activity of phytase family protein [Streptomyces sp. WI04-05B]MDX2582038.1 esterase-like activity of phytase family protein [Streptomyces sp. WI04-05A]